MAPSPPGCPSSVRPRMFVMRLCVESNKWVKAISGAKHMRGHGVGVSVAYSPRLFCSWAEWGRFDCRLGLLFPLPARRSFQSTYISYLSFATSVLISILLGDRTASYPSPQTAEVRTPANALAALPSYQPILPSRTRPLTRLLLLSLGLPVRSHPRLPTSTFVTTISSPSQHTYLCSSSRSARLMLPHSL